jgi:hypothetical protein
MGNGNLSAVGHISVIVWQKPGKRPLTSGRSQAMLHDPQINRSVQSAFVGRDRSALPE